MRESDRESYDVERGNGPGSGCCVANAEQLRNLKWKTYEELKGDQRTEGPVEERNGSRTKRVKQEDISLIGTRDSVYVGKSGENVDRSRYWSSEARNLSMER